MQKLPKVEIDTSDKVTTDEQRRLADTFEKKYTMRDTYAKTIEENLKKDNFANVKKLYKYIALYRQRYIKIFETPYPYDYNRFNNKDRGIYFDCAGVSEEDIKESIGKIEVPSSYTMKKAFVIGKYDHVIELMILNALWKIKADPKFINGFIYYMGYNYYWQAYKVSFPRYNLPKVIHEYTVNNLSNRFRLKTLGSVQKWIEYGIFNAIATYEDDIKEYSDYKSLLWVADRITTKFKGYMTGYAEVAYKNNENKNAIFTANSINEDGESYEDDSNLGDVSRLADKYTTKFLSNRPDERWIKFVAQNRGVSADDMRNSIEIVLNDENGQSHDELNAFFQAMFYLFLITEKRTVREIRSKRFIVSMNEVYKKGNSNDPNIAIVKKYIDKWLLAGSKTYRTTNRADTLNRFRRAIYEYFVYCIASNR